VRSRYGKALGILPDEFLEEELRLYKSGEAREVTMRFLKDPNAIALLAKEEGKVVGFARGVVRASLTRDSAAHLISRGREF